MSSTFDMNDIEELLAVMEQWDIAELHLQVEESRLDLVRALDECATAAHVIDTPNSVSPPINRATTGQTCPELVTIFAPVVGLFRLATNGFPAQIPQPGDQVHTGQNLGVIELMHIPSHLISPVSGIIEGILAEDGAGVEYGQPLMVIQPFEEVNEDEAGMWPPPR